MSHVAEALAKDRENLVNQISRQFAREALEPPARSDRGDSTRSFARGLA